MYTLIYIYIHIWIYMNIYEYVFVYIYICTHTHTNTRLCTYTAYCIWNVISSFSNLNRCSIFLGLFCHVPSNRDQRDWDWRLRFERGKMTVQMQQAVYMNSPTKATALHHERVQYFHYTYIYTHTHICIYTYKYMYIYIYVCIYIHICVYIYVFIYI